MTGPPRGPQRRPPPSSAPRVSLARALSKLGFCSRAEAVRLVEAGRVKVGGVVVRSPQRRIDLATPRLRVDDQPLGDSRKRLTIVLHKPVGYITSRTDPGGRPTVYALLDDVGRWVFPVGRLDRDTSGLLVLTNDHRLGDELTDPRRHVPKTYHVRVRAVPDPEAVRALKSGVPLRDGTLTRPAGVRVLGAARGGSTWLEMVLTEGKNRQVRRMCEAVGHDVLELKRVRVGGLGLGELPPGQWRRLLEREIDVLRRRSSSLT